mmetsp:Transcript_45921/g.71944  ORF Transcript_45921/g.71944 Transcript_45921/m.71944 type:complete len:350 (-) Transcript_45921:197-1246(-)|eukprot:CAMPEP_0184290632 /NCGR_PEP_ID=MMETSP1049-20130417/2767_1 /TAXON_ID=77928 /ORGANISM="Proteomonas sulcata, Strain CCMP704" /LENGTH=349 /DNA_ID=CAMNT_0026597823 /DNA_START=176 /DNA_END=1225 /DNA_ORIENTATION=+
MTDVEDQSQSNSCCANAVAGAYEYICKRKAMESGDTVGDISRLFIYYVGRKQDQVQWNEDTSKAPKDEGMTLGGAINALQMKGACLAENWPFDLQVVNQRPNEDCFNQAMEYKISEAVRVPCDLDAMRGCLAEGFPIVFGLKLTQRFFRPYPGGVVTTPDPNDPKSAEHGLHAMLLVGYSNRSQVFIVRNSWGTSWGDNGYAYVPFDYICNADFNFLGMYAIKGLTNTDFTPDDDDGEDLPDPGAVEGDADGDGIPDWEEQEDDDEEEQDDDFDADDMFNPLAEAQRAFKRYDLDGSGTIDKMELGMCLMMNGIMVYPWDLEKYMQAYDTDGSGRIGFSEFCAMCGIQT